MIVTLLRLFFNKPHINQLFLLILNPALVVIALCDKSLIVITSSKICHLTVKFKLYRVDIQNVEYTGNDMAKSFYKTVWLSDIHLGHKDCKAEFLLDFLKHNEIATLYLVGDIIDMWEMSKRFSWPDSHNDVLHQLFSMSQQGTKVIYLPGNHDQPLQKFDAMNFSGIEIAREYIHTTATGKKLLILHGDQFDEEVCFGRLHSWLGDVMYDFLLFLNRWYNWAREKSGYSYRSLASLIKNKVQGAHKAISRYRQACCRYAKKQGVDGVVCGHIHHPETKTVDGIEYFNDGDWIENCSALVETSTGAIQLIFWPYIKAAPSVEPLNKTTKKVA